MVKAASLPVMVILADHLEVPSSTLCLMVFICWAWMALLMTKTSLMSSKISGLFLSLIFILSFMAIMMFWVRSSAPCLELFSAAPGHLERECKGILKPLEPLSALLTLQAVGVQQLLALLVALDPTFRATHPLTSYSPQQPLALVAIRGRGGGPHLKVVRRGAGYGIDESLQRLLIDVILLQKDAAAFSRKSCSSPPEASCRLLNIPAPHP